MADSLSWKVIPPNPQYVLLGSNISLEWDYELAPGETTSGFFQVIWGQQQSGMSWWLNVAVKSSNLGIIIFRDRNHIHVDGTKRATLIITNVREDHHAAYRCSIESSSTGLAPANVNLIVLSK